jgi:hypothetical protein
MKTKQELVYDKIGAADPRVQISISVGEIWELMQAYHDQFVPPEIKQSNDTMIRFFEAVDNMPEPTKQNEPEV